MNKYNRRDISNLILDDLNHAKINAFTVADGYFKCDFGDQALTIYSEFSFIRNGIERNKDDLTLSQIADHVVGKCVRSIILDDNCAMIDLEGGIIKMQIGGSINRETFIYENASNDHVYVVV